MLVTEGKEATIESIESDLPKLSKIGSKDDMSVAFVYNIEELKAHITDFIQYQIDLVKEGIRLIDERIAKLAEKQEYLRDPYDEKSRIEAAQQDIVRANENRNGLLIKYDLLERQLVKEYCKK